METDVYAGRSTLGGIFLFLRNLKYEPVYPVMSSLFFHFDIGNTIEVLF